MKPHRIFIAVTIPKEVKTKLLAYKEKWPELPAKWTTEENLHLTLAFLGNTSDQELGEVCAFLRQVGERRSAFSVKVTKITYAPPGKLPRMIWAVGEPTPELFALQKDIAQTLKQGNVASFSPHLTLARLNAFQFRQMEMEELPDVNETISLSFPVQSVQVMRSELRRSGTQYTVCQEIPLQKK